VAIREFDGNHPLNYSVADENQSYSYRFYRVLILPKPSAEPSIKALHKLGVEVKVVTGDNDIVAKKYVMTWVFQSIQLCLVMNLKI
jgi:Mg2+-importing ATPase